MENNLEQQVQEQQDGLTIKDLFYIIRKHLIVILVVIFLCTILGFGFSKFQDKRSPKWSANATMIVSVENTDGMALSTVYSLSTYLTNTYVVFMKDNVVLEAVEQELSATYGSLVKLASLKKNLSTSIASNTLLMNVSFTSTSKEAATNILNCIINTAEKKANTVATDDAGNPLADNNGNPVPKYKLLYENLAVLSEAKEERAVQSTRTLKYTAIFFAGGIVLAFLYVLLRELTDNKFKNTREVEMLLGAPVFAGVPDYNFEQENGGKK